MYLSNSKRPWKREENQQFVLSPWITISRNFPEGPLCTVGNQSKLISKSMWFFSSPHSCKFLQLVRKQPQNIILHWSIWCSTLPFAGKYSTDGAKQQLLQLFCRMAKTLKREQTQSLCCSFASWVWNSCYLDFGTE